MINRGAKPSAAYLSLTVCLLLCGVLEGCRQPPKEIALIPITTGVALWDAAHAGAVNGAASCGLGAHYNAPARADDLQGQLTLFDHSLRQNYAGIILVPIQVQALRNPVQRAASAGLPIVVIGEDLGIRRSNVAYLLNDERMGGQMAADEVGRLLHGKGAVGIMGLDLNRASSLEREQGFEAELSKNFPGVHVIARRSGSVNLAQEQQIGQELLALPEQVDALVALSAASTRGAYFAKLNQGGRRPLHIVGFDQDLMTPINTGEIDGVVFMRTHELGRMAAEAICAGARGEPMHGGTVVTPLLVTAANIDSREVTEQLLGRAWWDEQ
jgi:ribose transport system substrate-binding protein